MARGLAVAVVAVLLLVAAAPVQAASGTFTCATIQAGIDQAQQGDVITLDSSAAPGGLCPMQVTLKSFPSPSGIGNYTQWTLKGRDGMNDGFDGTGLLGRIMTGNDVHRLELQELTFRDSSSGGNGGAVAITGESAVGLRNSEFFNNDSNGKGGAVYISQEPPVLGATLGGIGVSGDTFGSTTDPDEGNTAVTGGALAIETPGQGSNSGINGSTFANNVAEANGGGFSYELAPGGSENFSLDFNTVVDNTAGGSGGGAYVVVENSFLSIDQNTFEGNSVEPVTDSHPAGDHFGGGLYAEGGVPRLRNNVFRANSVKSFANGEDYGGGGLAVIGDGSANPASEFTRIEGNTVAGQPDASFESEGGGLFFQAPGAQWYAFLDAVAGNSVGPLGEGGGIYTGAANTVFEMGEVTIAGNTVGAGGRFAGIAGGGFDDLIMRNSIVYNGGPGDIGGFDAFDVQFSDACQSAGGAFAGPGNVCADPKLVGGSDVHQTKQSPTIDKGSDELYQQEGGERSPTDYEGDPRPTDGDGDGHTVDMGADETPAGFASQEPPPPPPPPPPPQCSDQVDNDSDGAIDLADPGCLPGPTDNNESDETERDLVLCGERTISLVRADVRGRRVVLSGIVAASAAGQRVRLSVRFLRGGGKAERLGSVTPGADGKFQARVKLPPRRLFALARYRATVGNARSVELKLPQSLASSSLRQVGGGMLELRGQVDRKLLGKRNAVVVKRILCGRYTTVGQAKPNSRGAYVVRFPAPATTGGAALYRAESRVLARPGSKRYVKQFARAIGITF